MEFFDKLGETLAIAGKDVTQKARDLSGIAKLNLDIKTKEDLLQKQYAQLGKQYYEEHKDDMDIENELFETIKELLDSIERMNQELLNIKGVRKCPNCGAQMADSAAYCANCGEKMDVVVDDSEDEIEDETVSETVDDIVDESDNS